MSALKKAAREIEDEQAAKDPVFKEILEFAFELQLDENLQKEKIIENIKEKYLNNYF